MDLKGSKTQKNLMKSFLGESAARNRYTFYASRAKKEGYEQIANIFLETANNESQHAKQFLSYLNELAPFEIKETYPIGFEDTLTNLKIAFEGEHEENTVLYPEYATTALKEGFDKISELFNYVISVEKHHEARFRTLQNNVLEKIVFEKSHEVNWVCLKCGYIHFDENAPDVCPLCHHPKAYFQMLCDNF